MLRINRRLIASSALLLRTGSGLGTAARAPADPFVGQIIHVGFTFCPDGWAEADGRLMPISQNTALYSLLGTTYGGNGTTTFALPDLRGRVAVHAGQGDETATVAQGAMGGAAAQLLTFSNLPARAHTATTSSSGLQVTSVLRGRATSATTDAPAGASLAVSKKATCSASAPTENMAAGSVQSTVTGGDATYLAQLRIPLRRRHPRARGVRGRDQPVQELPARQDGGHVRARHGTALSVHAPQSVARDAPGRLNQRSVARGPQRQPRRHQRRAAGRPAGPVRFREPGTESLFGQRRAGGLRAGSEPFARRQGHHRTAVSTTW